MVSIVLAGVVSAGGLATLSSPVGGVAGFGDVPETSFYTEAVQWMVDNNITTGTSDTCFSPNDVVTRGQAAAFMWRMEGEPAAPPHPFTDVTKAWQQEPVSWMFANGITTGTTNTTYSPDDTLNRGQLAALLWRLAGEPAAADHPFSDVARDWQQGPVSWMANTDPVITTGTSATTFSPDDPVTRGQLATFFHRYKAEPAVTIDPTHPLSPPCAQQVAGPTTTTTTTTVAPAPGFGAGTHIVGVDISPGTYRARPQSGCYWERLSGFGGTLGEIIGNEFYLGAYGSAVVSIAPSDVGFSADAECGFWTSDLSPITPSPTADFGAGQYIVGIDIAPGTWRSTGGTGCYWERRSGHGGSLGEIIANDFTNTAAIVDIQASDVGFHADPGCGTWSKIG